MQLIAPDRESWITLDITDIEIDSHHEWSAVPSGLRRQMRLGREDEPVEVFGSY
jgi:hypothetical protein